MDIFTYGRDPWGREVFTHVAWNASWVFAYIGITFLVAHAAYILLSAHRPRSDAETDSLAARHTHLPTRVARHSFMARLFHWVMAGAVFVLLVTAFFPIIGMRFDWVNWHWTAGLVLTGSLIYYIIHTTFWLDFWSIWVGPRDIPEFRAEILRELGQDVTGPKPAKYPIGNRLYHLILVFVGTVVTVTGVCMVVRIGTPFLARNPYLLGEGTWGYVYVFHGLTGLSLVGLVGAHVYFAIRPSKWWVTRSMILGWITRREYLKHYEPNRWQIRPKRSE